MTTDPFVSQLAELCRGVRPGNPAEAGSDGPHPLRGDASAKWVIVPSHAVGRTLGERLALGGVDWVNLRFVTPFTLAFRTAAPWLLEQGLDPLPDDLGPSLVMRLLMERPADEPPYFKRLADQPRMGAALWSAINELRLAGISPAGLPREAFESPAKHAELSALLAAYESHLASTRKADAADVYRAGAAHAAESPIAGEDSLLEAPALGAVAPLVRAFLDALPGRRIAALVPRVPGLQAPRRLRQRPADEQDPASSLAFLLAPDAASSRACQQTLTLFHAAGREAEVEGVYRRILSASPALPLDRVEVVCAAPDAAALFWEKAGRLGLPVTLEAGIPAIFTRPARAILGLCGWIDGGFPAPRLRRLLQGGDVRIEFPDGGGGGLAARLLAQSEATWGRDTYAASLAALADRYRASTPTDEEPDEEKRKSRIATAAQAEFLARWIEDLLALLPRPAEGEPVVLADLVAGVGEIITRYGRTAGPLDVAAGAAIGNALTRLAALGDFRCPMRQALAFVRDAVERQSVGASRPRPGHLHVSRPASAGYAGRPFTFIVGLEEGAVFPSLLEDPVLLDAERRKIEESQAAGGALRPAFPTSHDRLAEAVHAVVSRLAVIPLPGTPADGGVCLSYSCRDLRDGRETAPSWLMLQAARLKKGDPDLTYEALRRELQAPETLVAPVAAQALTDSGWWLASLKDAGDAGAKAVLKAFPALAAGRVAADNRESDDFTEWDGFVPAARAVLDPRVSGRPVSPTRLERLVSCPFRYFLEHGLGLEAMAEEPDRDEWLDPLQRGAALHEIFARLGRQAKAEGRRPSSARDAKRARQAADETLAALRAQCPPPSEMVFEHERADFLHDVELFLRFEDDRRDGKPVGFEVAFGHEDGSGEALAQAAPVKISLGKGGSFLLRGTIDRIDRLPDGSYAVIDYKTGKYDPAKWKGTFRQGAMLQHALYALAAAELLRGVEQNPRVAGGVYEFPSARGGGERTPVKTFSRNALTEVLSDLFDVMAQGTFLSARDGHECDYCDFPRACGKPVEQAAAKLANDDNEVLAVYERLERHD